MAIPECTAHASSEASGLDNTLQSQNYQHLTAMGERFNEQIWWGANTSVQHVLEDTPAEAILISESSIYFRWNRGTWSPQEGEMARVGPMAEKKVSKFGTRV